MSLSHSSSTSSPRSPPRFANKPRSYYKDDDKKILKVTKNRKRKALDKSRFANLDQMQSGGPANLVNAPPTDNIELQYLTAQELWSDYQQLLQVHRAQKTASAAALEDLLTEISTLGSSLDAARTLHEEHHVSLSEALQQAESMASERDSAEAEVQQLQQACAEHRVSLSEAKWTADERDSAEAEVQQLKQAYAQHQADFTKATQQAQWTANERDFAQAEVQQLQQACAQHQADFTEATQQAQWTAVARDSAQAEVRKLHNELKEAEADSRRRVDEVTEQMVFQNWTSQNDSVPDFWPSEESIDFTSEVLAW